MARAAKGTGPDYARLLGYLNNSKLATTNNAAYQTINGLINGVKKFQDFASLQFTSITGTTESLFTGLNNALTQLYSVVTNSVQSLTESIGAVGGAVTSITDLVGEILDELFLRNNTDFGAGGTGSDTIPNDSDSTISLGSDFDSGGMISGSSIIANGDGQHIITASVVFDSNGTGYRKASLRVNGSEVARTQVNATAVVETAISVCASAYMQAGDSVSLVVLQNSGGSLLTTVTLQVVRLTYVG